MVYINTYVCVNTCIERWQCILWYFVNMGQRTRSDFPRQLPAIQCTEALNIVGCFKGVYFCNWCQKLVQGQWESTIKNCQNRAFSVENIFGRQVSAHGKWKFCRWVLPESKVTQERFFVFFSPWAVLAPWRWQSMQFDVCSQSQTLECMRSVTSLRQKGVLDGMHV